MKVLASIVNYGNSQLQYLQEVVTELKCFKKYDVTVIVNSNISLDPMIEGIDKTNIISLSDYEYLPLTCRKTILDNVDNFSYFIFTENDHLWREFHLDKFREYNEILSDDRITGLIQYEDWSGEGYEGDRFYPAFHAYRKWELDSVEVHGGKIFAKPTNTHQASFLLTQEQVKRIHSQKDFTKFFREDNFHVYSEKCKVNTDIYEEAGMKKLICISEFEENQIQHLPNVSMPRQREGFDNDPERMGKWDGWMNREIEKMIMSV